MKAMTTVTTTILVAVLSGAQVWAQQPVGNTVDPCAWVNDEQSRKLMSPEQRAELCEISMDREALLAGKPTRSQLAQPPSHPIRQTKMKGPWVGAIGVALAFVGAGLALPYNEGDNWSVNGHTYCDNSSLQGNRIDFQAGSCAYHEATAPRLGYTLLAAGGGMMLYGFHRVEVAPSLGRSVIGATATVKW